MFPEIDPAAVARPRLPSNVAAAASRRKWYDIKNATNADGVAEVRIYDMIGWPFVTADQFIRDLEAITAPTIELRVNCPGGDVFEGVAIHNALERHPARKVAFVDGLAASTASWVILACDEIRMADNSYLVIHNPQGCVCGEADDMRQRADVLDQIAGTIAGMYAEKTGGDPDAYLAAMAEETWYTAAEAQAEGLCDQVVKGSGEPADGAAAATQNRAFDLSNFTKTPAPLRGSGGENQKQSAPPKTIRQFEDFLRDAGYSAVAARNIAAGGFKGAAEPRDGAAASKGNADPRDEAEQLVSLLRSHVAATSQILTP